MAINDLGEVDEGASEEGGNQLGLAPNAYYPFADPLAYAPHAQANQSAPGLHVPGAQAPQILMPRGGDPNTMVREGGGAAPATNPATPSIMQNALQSQQQNGFLGGATPNINQLLQMRAQAAMLQNGGMGPAAGNASGYLPQGAPYDSNIVDQIKTAATKYGIDPNVAVAVARSEGLSGYTGDGGSSFGPFQLHMGGLNPKMSHNGMGDDFKRDTNLDPRDPKTVPQQIDYALKRASQEGWGAWSGSRDSAGRYLGLPTEGISPFYGIKGGGGGANAPSGNASNVQGEGTPGGGAYGGNAMAGNPQAMQNLWKLMMLRTLFPQFQFSNISYDPWKVRAFGQQIGRGG